MNPVAALLLPLFFAMAPALDGWLGVYLDTERTEAVVSEVIPGSPAAKAGLQAGDVLLAVDDKATATRQDFVAAIGAHAAGDRVRLKLRRGTKEEVVVVKLAEREDDASSAPQPVKPDAAKSDGKIVRKPAQPSAPTTETKPVAPAPAKGKAPYLGLSVRTTDDGVVIERVVDGGPAKGSGLAAGDRITTMAEKPVRSLADMDAILGTLAAGQKVTIGVRGEAGVRSVTLTLGEHERKREVAATPPTRDEPPAPAAPAPKPASKPMPEASKSRDAKPAGERDVDAEIEALRKELKELRKQLEELKQQGGGR